MSHTRLPADGRRRRRAVRDDSANASSVPRRGASRSCGAAATTT